MSVTIISPREAFAQWNGGKDAVLVDVRTPVEVAEFHVDGSVHEPVQSLAADKFFAGHPEARDRRLLMLCKAGGRARSAAGIFEAAGYTNVAVIDGGITAWREAGLPVKTGAASRVLPLERQTQIAIGSFLLIFSALGFLVSPWFFLGCTFVGLGLLNAGISGLCPLAIVIGAMPWNNVRPAEAATTCCGTGASKGGSCKT